MSKQTAIRLPDDTLERLDALAMRTGRTKAFYIREAIERHLEDMEDIAAAEETLERLARGESRTYSLSEVKKDLGLDN